MPATETKTLYLIDGYAALFRSFYAIRNPLHSAVTGEPTNAILVFAQMLLKLYATLAPDYVVVAWDAPGKTFRDALFAQYPGFAPPPLPEAGSEPGLEAGELLPPPPTYKGTRQQTPDALHAQTPRIFELLALFGIPVIGVPGLEADDVIATLTTRLLADPACADVRVRIATRDKDMEQLIGARVTLFDIHTGAEMDEAALWEKRGITPAQVVDFLALTGDVVDNIPGVAGIGQKTAAKLLQQFGSLQGIWEAAGDPEKDTARRLDKVRESLERARPSLPISRRLVTLEREADIPFVLEDARSRPIPAAEMADFCDALGMMGLKKQYLLHGDFSAKTEDISG